MDKKGGLHQANGHESSDVSQATRVNDRYIDNLYIYTSSLRRGISITSKATSTLGYSMDFFLLNLITQSEA